MKTLLIALMSGALLFGSYAVQARTSSYHSERASSAHTEYSQHTRNARDRYHHDYRRDARSHNRRGHYRSARYGHHYGWHHHHHSYHRSYYVVSPYHHYR